MGKDAFSSFERFEQRVEASEAEASAHGDISGEMEDIEKQIQKIDTNRSVDDELKALKAKLKEDGQ